MVRKVRRLISLLTPNGIDVGAPEKSDADISKKFGIHDMSAAKKYFEEFGYVVFKSVFDERLCSETRAARDQDRKPSNGYTCRQVTAKSEKNKYNGNGWVMDPILDLQSRVLDVDTGVVNGVQLWRSKDQSKFMNKLMLLILSYLPLPFYWVKRSVIRKL